MNPASGSLGFKIRAPPSFMHMMLSGVLTAENSPVRDHIGRALEKPAPADQSAERLVQRRQQKSKSEKLEESTDK